jgi:hypothetical protein
MTVVCSEALVRVTRKRMNGVTYEHSTIADATNPARELRVPDEGVSTDQEAILQCEVDDCIPTSEIELKKAGLSRIPLNIGS